MKLISGVWDWTEIRKLVNVIHKKETYVISINAEGEFDKNLVCAGD